jgi:uncharacterized protein (DUF2235 family)
MRRLIICADGTWNRPDEDDHGVEAPTNVTKLARAIRPVARDGMSQIVSYHLGVGTGSLMDKVLGGAFGEGLDRHVLDCYRFLVDNYVVGDELYLFGFSRGAYTVRSLAGLIRNSGLLTVDHAGMADQAFQLYRDRDPEKHPTSETARRFREQYAYEPHITCIGVWDTVGALGIPVGILEKLSHRRHAFHDVTLSSWVDNAFHALAIDERREPFRPALWEKPITDENWLEQAWFAGVHSNVGGGYADPRLADVTLRWMAQRVNERCGLDIDQEYLDRITRPASVGRLYDSMSPFFKPLGEIERRIDEAAEANRRRGVVTCEYVHESVQARLQALTEDPDAYRPHNLDEWLKVPGHGFFSSFTPPGGVPLTRQPRQ